MPTKKTLNDLLRSLSKSRKVKTAKKERLELKKKTFCEVEHCNLLIKFSSSGLIKRFKANE